MCTQVHRSLIIGQYVRHVMTANYWYEKARNLPVEHPWYERGIFYDALAFTTLKQADMLEFDRLYSDARQAYHNAYHKGIRTIADYGKLEYNPDYFAWSSRI